MKVGTVRGSTFVVVTALVIYASGFNDPFILVNAGGGSQRLQLILGKQLDASPFSVAEYLQYKTQDIKAIAVMDEKRDPMLPDLSTGVEQGVDAVFSQTHCLLAPKDTPDAIVTKMAKAVKTAIESSEVGEVLKKQSLSPDFLDGEAYSIKFSTEGQKIAKIVQEKLLKK